MLNLYHISQEQRRGYDTYSDAVVAAESEDEAKQIHPSSGGWTKPGGYDYGEWASEPANVEAELIGEAVPGTEKGVIIASFHAG